MGLMLVSLNQPGLCRVRPCLRKKKCITPKVGIFMVSTKIMCAYSAGMDLPQQVCGSVLPQCFI